MDEQPGNSKQRAPLSRRAFLKGCTIAAGALGLSENMIPKLVEAAESTRRPSVIWLHFQQCSGCTGSLLRASHPDIGRLILDIISLEYHETIMAPSGQLAEKSLHHSIEKNNGKFILVAEGAVPTANKGIYCKIGGRTAMDMLADTAPGAAAVIAIGSCAAFGGIQAAAPNPTGAKGVEDLVSGVPIVNIPGCPPNPITFLGTLLHYLTFKRLPNRDHRGRPLFAYGRRIHDHCERRAHFDEGRFVEQFGDFGHKNGYCLYKVGCKGPETFSNCPAARFNDVTVWPVSAGHGCVGCTEPGFWDNMTPFYERLPQISIPGTGIITDADSAGRKILGVAGAAAGIHAAVGIGKSLLNSKDKDRQ